MVSLNLTFKMISFKILKLLCFTLGITFSLAEDPDVGLPLRLTPYIQSGNIEEAQRLALVTQLTPNITSYSGFLTVDEECDSNLFFWYFPSQIDIEHNPITLWLQGGPGSSSLYGLFIENGPYELQFNGELKTREYSWNREASILYIDNPVGTGYSFTKSVECYSKNESQVAENLNTALGQFFALFPVLKKREFFIAGESYAGKYIPALAHRFQTGPTLVNNLEGIIIGNGMIDPPNASNYSKLYYELGLVDNKTRDAMAEIEKQIQVAVANKNYTEAYYLRNQKLLDETFAQKAGFSSFFNFLYANGQEEPDYVVFVTKPEVRSAIHVGNATWHYDTSDVSAALIEDNMRSAVPELVPVLYEFNALFYYGQLDLRDPFGPSWNFIENMEWYGSFDLAEKYFWLVDNEVTGYGKTDDSDSLTVIAFRNAGHMVPRDQPRWAYYMYNAWIHGESLNNYKKSERYPIQAKKIHRKSKEELKKQMDKSLREAKLAGKL